MENTVFPAYAGPAAPTSSNDGDSWERFRPTILRLYIDENRRLADVVEFMKTQYGFDAVDHQYKHHFRKWKVKKNIPASKKRQILDLHKRRAEDGKSSAVVKFKGKYVDQKKLERQHKTEARKHIFMKAIQDVDWHSNAAPSPALPFGNKIFLMWNMPYGAMRTSKSRQTDTCSPIARPPVSTPSDVLIATPSSSHAPSPPNASLSMSVNLRKRLAVDRAHLFVQGRHSDLVSCMDGEERKTLSIWLYQFWLFSFVTAKHWGRGPRDWTADILPYNDHQDFMAISSPNTPGVQVNAHLGFQTPSDNSGPSPHAPRGTQCPTHLCRWAVHVKEETYIRLPSPPPEQGQMANPFDEQTWQAWPTSEQERSFHEKLRYGLETNDFSHLRVDHLPLEIKQVTKAAENSPQELSGEALGFSIMSRNIELTIQTLDKALMARVDIGDIYPFHIATSYLDGSKTCCNLLDALVFTESPNCSIRKLYTNHLGHTVLDSLMTTILKGHSSCAPGLVDRAWKKEKRFAGAEVDICGRWDADSSCIRQLLTAGSGTIPLEWKHKFCHTSAQTICHCITTIFSVHWAPDINTPSGIFLERCSSCDLKLQPLPLHTLVLTAFAVAQSRFEGENLFGILACTLCLLCIGANPLLTANLSLSSISGMRVEQCDHQELRPTDLAEELSSSISSTWSEDLQTGWNLLCYVLRSAEEEWRLREEKKTERERHRIARCDLMEEEDGTKDCESEYGDFDDEEIQQTGYESNEGRYRTHLREARPLPSDPFYCDEHPWEEYPWEVHKNFFGQNKILGTLWAVVQAEMLTYRRQEVGDAWISPNFNMHTLLQSLIANNGVSLGLLEKQLLRPFARCGDFEEVQMNCPTMQDVSADYFSNVDDWHRTTFIGLPERYQ